MPVAGNIVEKQLNSVIKCYFVKQNEKILIQSIAATECGKPFIYGDLQIQQNLAKMNLEIYKTRDNKQLQRDVTFLMWDWQTYVGKHCGGRPQVQKSRLWKEIEAQQ